jgi:hypothetical protein
MKNLRVLGILILLVVGIASAHAQESDASIAITLERGACFGTCPMYTLTIYDDGTVIYEGENFVTVTGEQTSQIDPATVELMVEAFVNAGYFDWNETYLTQTVSDLPTIITSVTHNGETHQIVRYTGDTAPLALPYLENWIDVMANTGLWTGVQRDHTSITNGSGTPIITLQRDPCFGFCPVYSVAVYEDGSVVYMGIANVDNIGVQVFQTDLSFVTSVIDRARLSGYFDWQDSYEYQFMTDQATVITSITTADQFKRIVRYGGDPNAPVGLVWVEDSIDQLATDLIG